MFVSPAADYYSVLGTDQCLRSTVDTMDESNAHGTSSATYREFLQFFRGVIWQLQSLELVINAFDRSCTIL
jgi:hypothetical protein